MEKLNPSNIEVGSAWELIPEDNPPYPHREVDANGSMGCWCNPDIFAYSDIDSEHAAYYTVEHHWYQ